MLDRIMELIRASLPEAVGGIIAGVVLALATVIWKRGRQRSTGEETGGEASSGREASIAGHDSERQTAREIATHLMRQQDTEIGSVRLGVSSRYRLQNNHVQGRTDSGDLSLDSRFGQVEIRSHGRTGAGDAAKDVQADEGDD